MPIFQRYGFHPDEKIELYTLDEVQQLLGISRNTLSRYINTCRIPSVTLNRRKYISKRNILEFLNGAKSCGAHGGYYRRKTDTMETPTYTRAKFTPNKAPVR